MVACKNVAVKLGGLGMPVIGFGWEKQPKRPTVEEVVQVLGPYIHYVIKLFGVDRTLYESNFPMDKVSFTYHTWFKSFKSILEQDNYSAADRRKIFYENAARIYRL